MTTLIPPPHEAHGAARVEMLNFSKRFGALQALDDVSITVQAGSFHALLGENGAGKSTLVKSLIGFYRADSGSVIVDTREQAIHSPRDAAALGLGMIFQHFTVVPGMSVAENLALAGRDLKAVIDWKAERAHLAAFMTAEGFPAGTMHMKSFRAKDSSFFDLFADPRELKCSAIEPLLQACPRRRFILAGDSGEKDPEIYGELARQYPNQVVAVLIRDAGGENANAERFEKAFDGLPKDHWQVFKDPAEIRLPPGDP